MALPPQMWLASMNVVSFLGSVMHVDVSAVAVVDWYTYALFIDIVTLSGPVCLLMMRCAVRERVCCFASVAVFRLIRRPCIIPCAAPKTISSHLRRVRIKTEEFIMKNIN